MSEQQPAPQLEAEPEQDLRPKASRIFAAPDTAEQCGAEYAKGRDVRGRLGWTDGA
ncbi:hypothetical protein ACFUEN_29055 [Streptomyces griseorubiginosus]|uniref:hypothetical protein n=1 Tax=Streptomyces griseorubiginosus TaxID=67304 RepID=UPI0036379FDA